jgi:RNA polymerase sigma factor (sigma-70 family)
MNDNITSADLKEAMNIAKARAYHYQSIGWTMFSREELVSAANEGICEAMVRFEPTKGTVKDTKFTSYAYFWIEKYLKEYITKNKTMLNGTGGELWSGQVPYTRSIDALDCSDSNTAGSDHKDWLGTNVLPSSSIEASERSKNVSNLIAKIFMELDSLDRLCIQLHLGIGTIDSMPLSIRAIARQTCMTRTIVEQRLANAYAKMQECKCKYAREFELA